MANNNDKYRLNYGASDYNPDSGSGSVSFGRVGTPVRDLSNPGRTVGSGVGVKFNTSFGGGSGSAADLKKVEVKGAVKKNAKGGPAKKPGLYDNINAKRERIAAGSGEKMRKPGTKGAPTADAFKQSAKTASYGDRQVKAYGDMIKKAAGGKVQTSSDTARKLATEMGGMKKGGVQKKALGGTFGGVTQLSVKQPVAPKPTAPVGVKQPPNVKQIADVLRGKATPVTPVKSPVVLTKSTPKPPVVVKPTRPVDVETIKDILNLRRPTPMQKTPGMDPRMMAKGGAGKVRKGMMSPQGSILQAVKPKKGGM